MIEAGTNIFRLNCSHRRGGDFERVSLPKEERSQERADSWKGMSAEDLKS